jgi:hypothetical protein
VDLLLPHSLQLLPGRKVSVDLQNEVFLPPGHFGQLTLKRSTLGGMKLLLHADLLRQYTFSSISSSSSSSSRSSTILTSSAVEDSEDGLVVVLENYGRTTAHLLAGVAYIQFLAVRCYTGQMLGGGDPPRVCDYLGVLGGAPPASTSSSAAAAATAAAHGGGGARALSPEEEEEEEEEQEPGQMLISEIDDLVRERVAQT